MKATIPMPRASSKYLRHRSSFLALSLLLVVLSLTGIAKAVNERIVKNVPLNNIEYAKAFELNRDANGFLWVSDTGAGEVWKIAPGLGGADATVYSGLSYASDARLAPDGKLWWSDYFNGRLGRYIPGQTKATTWSLPNVISHTLGIAFENSDRIWVTNEEEPFVHSYEPTKGATGEFCWYSLPVGGASSYILYDNGRIWLGDWINNRILALDPLQNEFTIWQLPIAAHNRILGLTVDSEHNLWWADHPQDQLGRLKPNTNELTLYKINLPLLGPRMVYSHRDRIWFTGFTTGSDGYAGWIEPNKATGTKTIISPTTSPAPPHCQPAPTGLEINVTTTTRTDLWSGDFVYDVLNNFAGTSIYHLPATDSGQLGQPWGLALAGNDAYFVDQGRKILIWLKTCFPLVPTYSGQGSNPLIEPERSAGCPVGEFLPGDQATVKAQPASGWGIVSWSGTDDDAHPRSTMVVTMPAAKHTVKATYGPAIYLSAIFRN